MTQFSNLGLDNFYMLPKRLFESDCTLSLEAKILFTLILDRADLSFMNDWRDKKGHLYVYYTIEEAQAKLGCGKSKAIRIFQELEQEDFIRRQKQGLGKPCMVYLNYQRFKNNYSKDYKEKHLESLKEFYSSLGQNVPEVFR